MPAVPGMPVVPGRTLTVLVAPEFVQGFAHLGRGRACARRRLGARPPGRSPGPRPAGGRRGGNARRDRGRRRLDVAGGRGARPAGPAARRALAPQHRRVARGRGARGGVGPVAAGRLRAGSCARLHVRNRRVDPRRARRGRPADRPGRRWERHHGRRTGNPRRAGDPGRARAPLDRRAGSPRRPPGPRPAPRRGVVAHRVRRDEPAPGAARRGCGLRPPEGRRTRPGRGARRRARPLGRRAGIRHRPPGTRHTRRGRRRRRRRSRSPVCATASPASRSCPAWTS